MNICFEDILEADGSSGNLYWKISIGRIRQGTVAGSINKNGYSYVKVKGKQYKAHRLLWKLVYGSWPKLCIDHINGNTLDNRISNLREVSTLQNAKNRKLNSNSISGIKGVSFNKASNKWRAYICSDGKQKHLGLFASKEKAAKVYAQAAEIYHKEYVRK